MRTAGLLLKSELVITNGHSGFCITDSSGKAVAAGTSFQPFNGTTNWKILRDHFERVAKVNGWTSNADKTQHLSLCLEDGAADVLRDLDDSSESAYDDIWRMLARRFGHIDDTREAMRRFDLRKQSDSETIAEFEQGLRTLYREAWPSAPAEQRDSALKRRFEDGVNSAEMSQYLRLHSRDDNFKTTVEKARRFAAATDAKPKKSVRLAIAPDDAASVNIRPRPIHSASDKLILDKLADMEDKMAKLITSQHTADNAARTNALLRSPSPLSPAMGRLQHSGNPPRQRFDGSRSPRYASRSQSPGTVTRPVSWGNGDTGRYTNNHNETAATFRTVDRRANTGDGQPPSLRTSTQFRPSRKFSPIWHGVPVPWIRVRKW